MTTKKRQFQKMIFILLIMMSGASINLPSERMTIAADSKESKLKQLLQEKLGILEHIVDQMEKLNARGEVGFEELYEAHLAKHRAQLDLCETNQERIAILEKLLLEARRRENAVKSIPIGATPLNLQKARISCLEIEIELERLKLK